MTNTGGDRGTERDPARLRVRGPHRRVERSGAILDLGREGAQVAREIVRRTAGRSDVDESEKRRAQLAVGDRGPHRALVDRADRMAGRAREAGGDPAPDGADLALQRVPVDRRQLWVHAFNLPAPGGLQPVSAGEHPW